MCRSTAHIGTSLLQSKTDANHLRPCCDSEGRRCLRRDGGALGGTEVAKKGRRWMFGSLNLKTLMWIFEQRSRLREAGSRRRRPRIHRQRLAEVPRCGLRVAGVQGEETKIDIGLGIPRV